MSKELVYVDAQGKNQALDLSLDTYRAAADAGQSLPQYLAANFPTDAAKYGTVMEQAMEQAGMFVYGDSDAGINSTSLADVLNPRQANAITRDGAPLKIVLQSRPRLIDLYINTMSALATRAGPENIDNTDYLREMMVRKSNELLRDGAVRDIFIRNLVVRPVES